MDQGHTKRGRDITMKYFWVLLVTATIIIVALLPMLVPSDAYNDAVKLMGPL